MVAHYRLARWFIVAAMLLPALLVACGSDTKKVEVEEWVEDVCDLARASGEAEDEAFDDLDLDFEDTEANKEAFLELIEKSDEARKDFRDGFADVGEPDIAGGADVVKAFKEQFEENDEQAKDLEEAIKDIDDDDNFLNELDRIGEEVDERNFRGELEDLADDEDEVQDVIDLIEDDEECAEVLFDGETSSGSDDDDSDDPQPTRAAGNDDDSNEEWVTGICTAFGDWVNTIEVAEAGMQTRIDAATDVPGVLDVLVQFMERGRSASRDLQDDIDRLDPPDVDDGNEIHQVFADAAAGAWDVFDDLVRESRQVSASTPEEALGDVERISAGIGDAFDEVGLTFDRLNEFDATALEDLFEDNVSCQELGS